MREKKISAKGTVITLSSAGKVTIWSSKAESMTGYFSAEILGKHFTTFHSTENLRRDKPTEILRLAATDGHTRYADWHVRKDGSHFWANLSIVAEANPNTGLLTYHVDMHLASPNDLVTENLRARNAELEGQLGERTAQLGERTEQLGERTEQLGERTEQLGVRTDELGTQTTQLGERTTQLNLKTREFNIIEALNKELEAFTYAASHDLRAPLRSIDGFSLALLEDYKDKLDAEGQDYLNRIRNAAQRMGRLIDDLIGLSSLTRGTLKRSFCDLAVEAKAIAAELHATNPGRAVKFEFKEQMLVECDVRLIRIVLQNLLGNAFKYTSKTAEAQVEVGFKKSGGVIIYYVRDNGAGFDMKYVHKLFGPFQRLHDSTAFEGNGIGLATVQRIIHRHGGHVWAEGEVDKGATVFFTL